MVIMSGFDLPIRAMRQQISSAVNLIVLLARPPVLFGTMLRLNDDYIMLLFENSSGQKMLVGTIIMHLILAFVIKKNYRNQGLTVFNLAPCRFEKQTSLKKNQERCLQDLIIRPAYPTQS